MSRASVIVSLLLAVVLTGVSVFTLRPADSGAAERRSVLEFDPASVTALSVASSGGEVRVERGRLPGQWLVRPQAGDEAGEGEGWPIAAERMRAALRVLAELRGRPADESLAEGAATLTLEREGADPLMVRIAPPALGGRRLVEVSGGAGAAGVFEIDDWLHEAMVTSGPAEWRDKSAMPGVGVEASRVRLMSGPNHLTLSRAGGRWGLIAPVGARASGEAVEALLNRLAKTQVVRFYDNPPADDVMGLDEPLAEVRVERERQIPVEGGGAEMRRVTEQVTLTVGGPIDATMAALFARVTIESSLEGAPRGQAVVAVSAEDLQRINPTPNAYISPQAVGAPASEIGGLAVGRAGSEAQVALERGRSGWELQGAAAGVEGGATVSEARGQAVDEAVRLMCEAPAGAVLIEPPAGYEPQVTVELQSLGGSPLEIVDVGDMPAPQQAKQRFLVIRTRQTYRVYESSALGTLELLADLAGQAGAPSGHEAPAAEQMDEARDELPVGG